MRIPHLIALSAALLLGASCSRESTPASTPAAPVATAPAAAPAAKVKEAVFGQEELDQMLAPIALYPDPLLAQVLMAATYPGDVAEAAAWSKANPKATGDEAVKQVAVQPWDPSVQALVAFPQSLATLGQDPAWVQRLGDAFLAQPDDVMDAVQRLRHQAQTAGNLESNEYQNVTVQPAAAPAMGATTGEGQSISTSTIVIEPADPQVVYVPAYNPTNVYGAWAYPSYPPVYYPPPPSYYMGSALAAGLAFGVGVAITDSLWGDLDWGDDDIDIDVDRYNNINVNRQINVNQNNWQHNAVNRDGVPYRDRANREQYSRRLAGADTRESFRGDDGQRAQAREQARASMEERGMDRPATSNREARDRAREGADSQARDRARATTDRAQTRDRAQADGRNTRESPEARDRAGTAGSRNAGDRSRSSQMKPRGQSSSQSRQGARKQQSARAGGASNNAFAGARSPSQSKAQASRGQASRGGASRSSSSRPSSGKQVNRQSRPPQRQGRGR